jgi:hypothetical protein
MFKPAERKRAKLRMALVGPSGSGKTYSALLLANGIGGKIAVIDTENSSAELYADLCKYDVCTIHAPYTVDKYLTALEEAEKAGYAVVIIDSISHAWAGEGGLLDQQGKIADSSRNGNSYTAWREITPKHNKFVEKMLSSSCHLIATMRAKQEYVLETNDKGKTVPKKIGLAPVQREGMEYEFTAVLDIDIKHQAKASKDRTRIFGDEIEKISADTGKRLVTWLETGKEPDPAPAASPDPQPKKWTVKDMTAKIVAIKELSALTRAVTYINANYTGKDLELLQVAIMGVQTRLDKEQDGLPFPGPSAGQQPSEFIEGVANA